MLEVRQIEGLPINMGLQVDWTYEPPGGTDMVGANDMREELNSKELLVISRLI